MKNCWKWQEEEEKHLANHNVRLSPHTSSHQFFSLLSSASCSSRAIATYQLVYRSCSQLSRHLLSLITSLYNCVFPPINIAILSIGRQDEKNMIRAQNLTHFEQSKCSIEKHFIFTVDSSLSISHSLGERNDPIFTKKLSPVGNKILKISSNLYLNHCLPWLTNLWQSGWSGWKGVWGCEWPHKLGATKDSIWHSGF